jgi:hypothetical protein
MYCSADCVSDLTVSWLKGSNIPAMIRMNRSFGRHSQTTLRVLTLNGPLSSQNIFSTDWFYLISGR